MYKCALACFFASLEAIEPVKQSNAKAQWGLRFFVVRLLVNGHHSKGQPMDHITEKDIEDVFAMAEELLAKIEADPRNTGGEIDEILACVFRVLRRWCLGSVPRLDALIARRAAVVGPLPSPPPLSAFALAAHRRKNKP